MRIKTRKISRAQRILSHGSALSLAMMRAQTFSVYAKPQAGRAACPHKLCSFFHDCVLTLAFVSHGHIKKKICITKL